MGKPKSKAPRNRQTKLYLTFNDEERTTYLTGFHKRKVERKRKAKEELVQQMKEEQKRLKDERRQQFMDLMRERRKAQGIVNDLDELDLVTTSKTESVQYHHPNHTVTVTTISDLDLCHPEGLKLGTNTFAKADDDDDDDDKQQQGKEGEDEARGEGGEPKDIPLPNKKQCLTSKRLSSLMSSLDPKKNKSGKKWKRGAKSSKKSKRPAQGGRTTKTQRRQRTGAREKKGGFSG
ncbi:nucleolar protein 12 [Lethenteron reissneri]|uniref:nucleolar protein 12 n=1 Tax=Lethenteron reissneri TaxID=7753 RepID=UPI002AB63590|nr:nucleolar protein 12 [Lethenteron reissneri]